MKCWFSEFLVVSNGLIEWELAVHEGDHRDEIAGGAVAPGPGLGGLDEGGAPFEQTVGDSGLEPAKNAGFGASRRSGRSGSWTADRWTGPNHT